MEPSDLRQAFAGVIEDLSQYLEYQKDLGNTDFEVSPETRSLIEKWGTPDWRADMFSCQGPESAALMVVDSRGLFFTGDAGDLLVKILKAMHLTPDRIFICNAGDVDRICSHIRKNGPQCILCLGGKAGRLLLGRQGRVGEFRGQFFSFENTPAMVTHHPAELLGNPGLKRHVWDDVQQVMFRIGI